VQEADYYLTLLMSRDGQLQVAGMTLEWVALALQNREKIRTRVSEQGLRLDPDHALVELALYNYVAGLMEFDESRDRRCEICEQCAAECVDGLVEFCDKSLLTIGLPRGFILDCLEDREQASADLGEFLTYIGFGDEVAFTDILVLLEDFKRLKKEDDFALYFN